MNNKTEFFRAFVDVLDFAQGKNLGLGDVDYDSETNKFSITFVPVETKDVVVEKIGKIKRKEKGVASQKEKSAKKSDSPRELNDAEKKVVTALSQGVEWFTDLKTKSKLSNGHLGYILKVLVARGLVEKVSYGKYALVKKTEIVGAVPNDAKVEEESEEEDEDDVESESERD